MDAGEDGGQDSGLDATFASDDAAPGVKDAGIMEADGTVEASSDAAPGADAPSDSAAEASLDGGGCTPTGSLVVTSRVGPAARLLATGKVLVIGGVDTSGGHVLASAELYDPSTGTFSLTGPMSTPRAYFATAMLSDGKVFVAGGVDDQGAVVSTAEIYDPAAGTWSSPVPMGVGRETPTAVTLADGRVLVMGGLSQFSSFDKSTTYTYVNAVPLTTAEVYDPTLGSFSNTGPMESPRAWPSATLLPDGRAFIATGVTNASVGFTSTAETFRAAPADAGIEAGPDASADAGALSGSFTPAGMLPNGVGGYPFLATLPTGKAVVFITGGSIQGSVVTSGGPTFLFDPPSGTFSTAESDLIGASSSLLLTNGDIFCAGGGGSGAPTGQTEVFSAATYAWRPSSTMTTGRRYAAVANLPNGEVLVVGGCKAALCGAAGLGSAEICRP